MLTSSRDENIMTKDELPEEEEVVVSGRLQTSTSPLVRTTRIRLVDPLEGMIESMIQKPEEAISSSSTDQLSTSGVSSAK